MPEVRFDRLNEHYRDVAGLSRLILRHSAFEAGRGEVRASGFLMDMNAVFQEFVTQALRESLKVSDRVLCSDNGMPRRVTLDEAGRVRLKPDLSWWDGSVCTFVGDAKYKNITVEPVPNADLYQLLAYTTALDLPGGMLIYAQGEADTATHHVLSSGKRLEVVALDLSGALDNVLRRVKTIARNIKALRDESTGSSVHRCSVPHPRLRTPPSRLGATGGPTRAVSQAIRPSGSTSLGELRTIPPEPQIPEDVPIRQATASSFMSRTIADHPRRWRRTGGQRPQCLRARGLPPHLPSPHPATYRGHYG